MATLRPAQWIRHRQFPRRHRRRVARQMVNRPPVNLILTIIQLLKNRRFHRRRPPLTITGLNRRQVELLHRRVDHRQMLMLLHRVKHLLWILCCKVDIRGLRGLQARRGRLRMGMAHRRPVDIMHLPEVIHLHLDGIQIITDM